MHSCYSGMFTENFLFFFEGKERGLSGSESFFAENIEEVEAFPKIHFVSLGSVFLFDNFKSRLLEESF